MCGKVLLAHPGTQYSHQLAKQLVRLGCLSEFWTGFALNGNTKSSRLLLSCLTAAWRKKIANRIIDGLPSHGLRTTPLIEWQALRKIRCGEPAEQALHERNQLFQERIPATSIRKVDGVIGFDTSSWILAKQTRQLGKTFFLDQSIAHPRAKDSVFKKIIYRYPDWQEDIGTRSTNVLNCEEQEYELANKIVVASSFTKWSLVSQGVSEDKIVINPYGVDLNLFSPLRQTRADKQSLRFLFLGTISARKGIPLLLEAWRQLNLLNCELWLVGPVRPQIRPLIPDLPGLKVLGQYPHRELPNLLKQCDVLVFPSYFEGFAQVLLEALATGLPIITTDATAGPDLIQNGREGFIVPVGDLEALCQAMLFFVEHPDHFGPMAKAARRCAEHYSWDTYGDRWQTIIQENIPCSRF